MRYGGTDISHPSNKDGIAHSEILSPASRRPLRLDLPTCRGQRITRW